MSKVHNQAAKDPSFHWGLSVAAVAVFSLVLAALCFIYSDRAKPSDPQIDASIQQITAHDFDRNDLVLMSKTHMPTSRVPVTMHNMTIEEDGGRRILKMQLVPGGEQIIIDAETGKFIETRITNDQPAPMLNVERQAVPTASVM
jgi:hypothetical protein